MRWLALGLGLLSPGPALADAAADAAAAYDRGRGLSVVIGGRRLDADRARLGCAGCHGADGRGGREGGAASAPSILWSDLSAPTGLRPAYDEAAFLRALTQGADPAGRDLQMPRFAAPPALLAGLRGHLAGLEARQRAGIEGLRIAVRLPRDPGRRAAALAAIKAFNDEGGSWGRRVAPAEGNGAWFLDLDAALDGLFPRLLAAESRAAERALSRDPGLARMPGPGPGGALLLRNAQGTLFTGPAPEAVVWARRQGLPLDAARALALTGLILAELREAGPAVTRDALGDRLRDLDPAPAVTQELIPDSPADPRPRHPPAANASGDGRP